MNLQAVNVDVGLYHGLQRVKFLSRTSHNTVTVGQCCSNILNIVSKLDVVSHLRIDSSTSASQA